MVARFKFWGTIFGNRVADGLAKLECLSVTTLRSYLPPMHELLLQDLESLSLVFTLLKEPQHLQVFIGTWTGTTQHLKLQGGTISQKGSWFWGFGLDSFQALPLSLKYMQLAGNKLQKLLIN